jgi:hypothetical protein
MYNDDFLWCEKYRPKTVSECILPDNIKRTFQEYVNKKEIPNLLLTGQAGSGKTSVSVAMCNEVGCDYLFLNGSSENGIDTFRNKITNYASSVSLSGGKKVIIIDEADYMNCLEENQKILIGSKFDNTPTKIGDLSQGMIYPTVSFNTKTGEVEEDYCEVVNDSVSEVFEVELETGEKLIVTSDHPFIINSGGEYIECSINQGLINQEVIVL